MCQGSRDGMRRHVRTSPRAGVRVGDLGGLKGLALAKTGPCEDLVVVAMGAAEVLCCENG